MPAPQYKYWLLTIPHYCFTPWLPPSCKYIRGQLESGSESNYLHWQILAILHRKGTLSSIKAVFGDECHAEASRSEAASAYVWKEETRVDGTQFELGEQPFRRNNKSDWDKVREEAKAGRLDSIESDIYVRHYFSLKRIAKDNARAPHRPGVEVVVLWGVSGSGKSHRAFSEAGEQAYFKSSTTKWWDGYRGEENVVIDEFRGQIGVEHLLRWFDKYPCFVEEKGGQIPLFAKKFWVTSNLDPREWYKDLDEDTKAALFRRFKSVVHFLFQYSSQINEPSS